MQLTIVSIVLLVASSVAGFAQTADSLDLNGKLRFHLESVYSLKSMAGSASYAGLLQGIGTPDEWGQGGGSYGKRFASTVGCVAVYGAIAFSLDTALHQDPRYFPATTTGFWRRSGHALRGTILTRTDSGRETLSTWRLGGAYGSAYISNLWYPDRLNTVRLGALQGTLRLGLDFAANLGSEFWPDLKRKLHRRKP